MSISKAILGLRYSHLSIQNSKQILVIRCHKFNFYASGLLSI